DAAARGHEVELAGADRPERADRVPVQDLPREEPRDRLEAGVRVRGHLHAVGAVPDLRQRVRAVVVEEAPRADERARALRDRAPHAHRARAAERDVPVLEDLDHLGRAALRVRPGGAHALLGTGLEVAHASSVGAAGSRGEVSRVTPALPRSGPGPALSLARTRRARRRTRMA